MLKAQAVFVPVRHTPDDKSQDLLTTLFTHNRREYRHCFLYLPEQDWMIGIGIEGKFCKPRDYEFKDDYLIFDISEFIGGYTFEDMVKRVGPRSKYPQFSYPNLYKSFFLGRDNSNKLLRGVGRPREATCATYLAWLLGIPNHHLYNSDTLAMLMVAHHNFSINK